MSVNEKDFHQVRLEKANAKGLAPIAKENRRSIVRETNVAVENYIRNFKRKGDDRGGNSRNRRNRKRRLK